MPRKYDPRRRRLILAAIPLLVVPASNGILTAAPLNGGSLEVLLPPSFRRFVSPSGAFALEIATLEQPGKPRVSAILLDISGERRRVVWTQTLPHEMGPRTALVADSGKVVLVDEWINNISQRAVTVIDLDGHTLAQYSAEQLFALLNVPRSVISANARYGIWMGSEPSFSSDGKRVELRSAGRRLGLNIEDGRLTVSD